MHWRIEFYKLLAGVLTLRAGWGRVPYLTCGQRHVAYDSAFGTLLYSAEVQML